MKTRHFILLLIILAHITPAFATGQESDIIYLDGRKWELLGRPICADSLLAATLTQRVNEDDICTSTSNWFGFTGHWSVRGDLLVLDSVTYLYWVEGECVETTLPDSTLKQVFGFYCEDGIVVARWLSSYKLRLATGKRIRYQHMAFDRNYETEMILTIENGSVTQRTTFHNHIVCEGFAFKEMETDALQHELALCVKRYPQYDTLNRIYVVLNGFSVDTLGNLKDIEGVKVRYRGQTESDENGDLENDIKRHLMAIRPWELWHINGEYRTFYDGWILPIPLSP